MGIVGGEKVGCRVDGLNAVGALKLNLFDPHLFSLSNLIGNIESWGLIDIHLCLIITLVVVKFLQCLDVGSNFLLSIRLALSQGKQGAQFAFAIF